MMLKTTLMADTIISYVEKRTVLICMCYLYILDTNLLPVISFTNIFSHSVGCLFDGFLCCTNDLRFN